MTSDSVHHATAQWIATVDPATVDLAIKYTQGNHWILLWDALVTVGLCLLIIRSRILERMAERLERSGRGVFFVGFCTSAALFFALAILGLLWDGYVDWYRERRYDLATSSLGDWLLDHAVMVTLSAVALGLFFATFYGLLHRVTRRRPLWVGALVAAFLGVALLLYPVAIAPLFNTFEPARAGEIRDAVQTLAARANVPAEQIFIYDGSSQSSRYTARVSGIAGTARIMLSDSIFRGDVDRGAIEAVVAHEIGHYAEAHIAVRILFYTGFAALLFWLMERLFPPVSRCLRGNPRSGFDEPAGLPVVIILFTALSLAATPVLSGFTRLLENRADAFSLELAEQPDGLVRALLRTADYRAPSPSRVEELLFYDHPSIEHRIERAMRWKLAAGMALQPSASRPPPGSSPTEG